MIPGWAVPFVLLAGGVGIWWGSRLALGWWDRRKVRKQAHQWQRWGSREFDRNHRTNNRRDV